MADPKRKIKDGPRIKGRLLGARTLLVAPGPTTRSKKLLVTKGIATSKQKVKHRIPLIANNC